MIATNYKFFYELRFRYLIIIIAIFLLIISLFATMMQKQSDFLAWTIVILAFIAGILQLWFIPIVYMSSECVEIRRLRFFRQKFKWGEFRVIKSVNHRLLWSLFFDPRCLHLIHKDKPFLLRHVYIMSHFDDFEKSIVMIHKYVDNNDINYDHERKFRYYTERFRDRYR